MSDLLDSFFSNIGFRFSGGGPMDLRFLLQPLMSLILAVRAGIRDSKSGNTPYLWGLVSQKGERKKLISEGWKDIGKLFIAAFVLDIVYSVIVFKSVHPIESIVIAIILAFVPYLIFRGLVDRIISFFKKKKDNND